jgi:protein phosphatase
MNYAYLTDTGKVRTHNEDSVNVVSRSGAYLMVVADGMGGHKGGEIASSIACDHITNSFLNLDRMGDKEESIAWIKKVVSEANSHIYEHTALNKNNTGMGTTIVLALLTSDYLLFGSVGDSSGYVVKDNKLYKVTTDHTLVHFLVKNGELTEEEARSHPRKNILMKALGAATAIEMDIIDVERDVSGILLCSDGLTNMLSDKDIMDVLREKTDIKSKLSKLVYKSNNRGGTDNISVCYLETGVNNDN